MISFRQNLARGISIIGHPFLLMPLLTGLIAYRLLPPKHALVAEAVALGVVIIPAAVYTFIKVRRGSWNDLDVSNQTHRGQFYGMLILLLLILVTVSWLANVPRSIALGTTAIFLMVTAASLLNPIIKVSLHTGFSVFVACVLFLIQPEVGFLAFGLALAVAWSRVVLQRHTIREVLLGGILGGIIAAAFIASLRVSQ